MIFYESWRKCTRSTDISKPPPRSSWAVFYPPAKGLFWFEAGLYALANVFFSLKIALAKDRRLFPFLAWAFLLIHFSFGCNYLRGILDFWLLKKHLRRKIGDLPLTR